jgi:hypothetical protein
VATPVIMSPIAKCLDSNPKNCRNKQPRFQLSHPSPYLAFRLPGKWPWVAKEGVGWLSRGRGNKNGRWEVF